MNEVKKPMRTLIQRKKEQVEKMKKLYAPLKKELQERLEKESRKIKWFWRANFEGTKSLGYETMMQKFDGIGKEFTPEALATIKAYIES